VLSDNKTARDSGDYATTGLSLKGTIYSITIM